MKKSLGTKLSWLAWLGCLLLLGISATRPTASPTSQLIGARFPEISPDGQQIAFSYMGDIWVISVEGGTARRLTDHLAYEREPVWSPDGRWIAFASDRNGNNDVFIMPATGGEIRQLTFHSGEDIPTDFTPDGQWVIFTSNRLSSSAVYKIPINGGNARPLLERYWVWPYQAKISPDGNRLLFSLGSENRYWWRRGYRGSNSAKIWIKPLNKNMAQLVIEEASNCFWPHWGKEGQSVYFVSDREFNCKNIWKKDLTSGQLTPITHFKDKDVKWLSVARRVPLAVYERDFGLWITDLTTGKSRPISITAPTEPKDNRLRIVENAPVQEYRVSPDGRKIAAVVHGDIFVLSTDGGYARNITQSPWRERDITWTKDSRQLVYVCDQGANPDLYLIKADGSSQPERLTKSEEDELLPRFSPDGQWLAYYRGKRQLRLINWATREDSLLAEKDFGGRFADDFAWSPDSRFIAYVCRRHGQLDIAAVNIKTRQSIFLTNTAYDETAPYWSPEGDFLLYSANRYGHSFPEFTGKWDLYQVFLKPQPPKFKEDKFEDLFQPQDEQKKTKGSEKTKAKKEKKQVTIQIEMKDIDRQTKTVIDTRGNERQFVYSAKEKTVYFLSDMDGQTHLWKVTFKDDQWQNYQPFAPQLRSLRQLQLVASSGKLYYLRQGRIGVVNIKTGKAKTISFKTKIKVPKPDEYEQILAELYYTLKYYYYDEHLHHVDWTSLYQSFRPVLQQLRQDEDFYDYANEMIGYLNSSHTGIRPPRKEGPREPSGHVGAIFDFQGKKIVLKRIIAQGPLDFYRDKIKPGQVLTAIDGQPVDASTNLWRKLNGKIGERVLLTFRDESTGRETTVKVKPISSRSEQNLLLEEWITSRRQLVKEKTNDQVAYIYMRAMGRGDLNRFLKELERDAVPRKGLILDIRWNFGGNVHDRVLQALTKPLYAKWKVRGLSETPQSTFAFSHRPVVLLINEVTLSDGEMTANGFKTLKRGPILGETTYGWLIFTTSVRLLNGGYFRLPFWGCYTLDGRDLETIGGVKPDIEVVNDLNDELAGRDPQLEKAIEVITGLINQK